MRTVTIDYYPECTADWPDAVVAVDVIRATTTAITAAALGRRCLPVTTVEQAAATAAALGDALLVGELGGDKPPGFDLTNSPAAIAARTDVERPMVLLSSSGTQLLQRVAHCPAVYLACFRNHGALARYLAAAHEHVAVLGAGTRGEFREEDRMCCAWIAGALVGAGFASADERTAGWIAEWAGAPRDAFLGSKSVKYLRKSGQLADLEMVLAHFDDIDDVFALRRGEVVRVAGEMRPRVAAQ